MASNLSNFLEKLGELHDCRVTDLNWRPGDSLIEISLADIMANFEGLPEYAGPVAASIVLRGITQVHFNIDWSEKSLMIMEFSCKPLPEGNSEASILFWPSGGLTVFFEEAHIPKLEM